MSLCVREWHTHSGAMLNGVTPANNSSLPSFKGKGDSIGGDQQKQQRRVHLSNLASVPDQDSIEMAWMQNGYIGNGQYEEMQDLISDSCNNSQLNYASSWGGVSLGQGGMMQQDGILPSKVPAMLEAVVNGTSSSSVTATAAAVGSAGQVILPIKNFQEDEMISWLQDLAPDESLDQQYGSSGGGGDFFGELNPGAPDANNIQVFTDHAANNYALVSARVSNAETAMTLAACRAAGLIRHPGGFGTTTTVGADSANFSYSHTPQLGSIIPSSTSSDPPAGLNQGIAITESQFPFRTSTSASAAFGSLLAPMLPPKSKPIAAAAATANSSFASRYHHGHHHQQAANTTTASSSSATGAMNFPVFARPAALIKANLQSLNITSILPSNLMRFKLQQQQQQGGGDGGGRGHANLDASTSTSSSVTELTTKGQIMSTATLPEPRRNEFSAGGAQNDQLAAGMPEFHAASAPRNSRRSSNPGVHPSSHHHHHQQQQMASSLVSRKAQVNVLVSAGPEEAMDCGSELIPVDQDITCRHSSGTTTTTTATGITSAVVVTSDLAGVLTQSTTTTSSCIPEAGPEPTITSASAGGAVLRGGGGGGGGAVTSDPGGVTSCLPEAALAQEPTITSAWGGGGSSNNVALADQSRGDAKESMLTANKKKSLGAKEVECPSGDGEDESLELKKPVRGSTTKRNRAAEVHNLYERRRRDRINEKMKSLQELIPNSNKTDKASMLDEAIEYIKTLQLQLQMMSMRSGMNLPLMVLPPRIQHLQMPQMPQLSQMAMSMSVGMGMGSGMGMGATGSARGVMPVTSATGPILPHNSNVTASMMMEAARDSSCLVNPNMTDSRNVYHAHQHRASQFQQQPVNMEIYNAYILQQQQQQHYQLQQEQHQTFAMAARPLP